MSKTTKSRMPCRKCGTAQCVIRSQGYDDEGCHSYDQHHCLECGNFVSQPGCFLDESSLVVYREKYGHLLRVKRDWVKKKHPAPVGRVRIIEKNGKWESTTYCIDPQKLKKDNPVDASLLKELAKISKRKTKTKEAHVSCNVEADGDMYQPSEESVVAGGELVIWLHVDYEL